MRIIEKTCIAVLLGLPSLLVTVSAGAEELSRGGMLSASCAGCHGTDGRSPGAIPSINGKSAEYISNALKDYRSGRRDSTVMGRHAKAYTDEEIMQIAEYMASRK